MIARDTAMEVEMPPTLFDSNPPRRKLCVAQRRNEGRYRGSGRDWATPPELYDELNSEFSFDLDPCASHQTAKCKTYFSESQNGLIQDWGCNRVFMNPPYGRELPQWTAKAKTSAKNGALVVGLLPAATDSGWWHEDVLGCAEIRYLRKRPRFLIYTEIGVKWSSPFQPCVIIVWRPV